MLIKNKYKVYTPFERTTYEFDTEEEALSFFDNFIGDAILLDSTGVINSKNYVESFTHLIHAALCFHFGRYIDFPNEETMRVYEDLLPLFKNSDKGVALIGPYGVGKTTIMKVFSLCIASGYIAEAKPFKVVPLSDIAISFKEEGFATLDTFKIGRKYKSNICLDDIGTEIFMVKDYGNDIIVFPQLMMELYDTFISHHSTTHLTTNLLPEDIEKKYGGRTLDRISEMCQIYVVDGESKRG